MLTEKQITQAQADDEGLLQLYREAFPPEEQIPWRELLRLVDEMGLDFTAYYDSGRLIGFTIVYPHAPFNWFWYFAVSADVRGQGHGSCILQRILARYNNRPLILDMESPEQPSTNANQRRRRHEFYLRHGFTDTHVGRTFDGVAYTILLHGQGTFTRRDYDAIIADLRRHWQRIKE